MLLRKLPGILVMGTVVTGLLMLGWGIRDPAGYFDSLARGVFLVLIVTALVSASLSAQAPASQGTRTPPGQRIVLALVQLVTLPLLVFLPFADRRGMVVLRSEWIRWLGLAMVLAGNMIAVVAIRTLGKHYSVYVTIQDQHQLVQGGIYGVVRNPIYLGTLLLWPGACLVFRSWLGLPVFGFFLLFAVLRGAQEERVLRDEFGDEFEAYRRRTWRILPYIY